MIGVEASRVIDRSNEQVWAYLSDLDHMPAWDPGFTQVRWERPLRPGSDVEMHDAAPFLRRVGRFVPPHFRVRDLETGRSFGLYIARDACSFGATYSLEPLDAGHTRVTRVFTVGGHGPWKLFELAVSRRAISEREAEVSNLKRVLEGPSAGTLATTG